MKRMVKVFPLGKKYACGCTKFEVEVTFETFQEAVRYCNGRNNCGTKKGQMPLINL